MEKLIEKVEQFSKKNNISKAVTSVVITAGVVAVVVFGNISLSIGG